MAGPIIIVRLGQLPLAGLLGETEVHAEPHDRHLRFVCRSRRGTAIEHAEASIELPLQKGYRMTLVIQVPVRHADGGLSRKD